MPEYKIYIDTSDRKNRTVKLVSVQGESEKELARSEGDIDVVVSVQRLLSDNDLSPKDNIVFVPNKGPGSFTGLKTGVTVANVLNWATGKKSIKELDMPEYGADPNITTKKSH